MATSPLPSVTDGYSEANGHHAHPKGTGIPPIINIQQNAKPMNLEQDIVDGLRSEPKALPGVLLWNTDGLKLFHEITQSPDYYSASVEIELLSSHVDEIAKNITSGSVVIELGSGNSKKTMIFLKAIIRQKKHISYYALDLSESELRHSLTILAKTMPRSPYIRCQGLLGSYSDIPHWIQRNPTVACKPILYLWMGNSIANHTPQEAISLLSQLVDIPRSKGNPKPSFIIAVDDCRDAATIHRAYNIKTGLSRNFILNGLRHANALAKQDVFVENDWAFKGIYHEKDRYYRSYYVAKKDLVLTFCGEEFRAVRGEMIHAIDSRKWDEEQIRFICRNAGLKCGQVWRHERVGYGMYLLEPGMGMGLAKGE